MTGRGLFAGSFAASLAITNLILAPLNSDPILPQLSGHILLMVFIAHRTLTRSGIIISNPFSKNLAVAKRTSDSLATLRCFTNAKVCRDPSASCRDLQQSGCVSRTLARLSTPFISSGCRPEEVAREMRLSWAKVWITLGACPRILLVLKHHRRICQLRIPSCATRWLHS